MMGTSHIQCKHGCTARGSPLFLLGCGVCIYHDKCVPATCRCERTTAGMARTDFATVPCCVQNCKRPRDAETFALCAEHAAEIGASLLGKLKILGKMRFRDVRSFLECHPDLRKGKGDMLQLAESQVLRDLDKAWQAVEDVQRGVILYVSVYLAQKTEEKVCNVKEFVAQHGFPSQAATLLNEDARAQRHGWQLLAGGHIGPKTHRQQFDCADDLFAYLAQRSSITQRVETIVALYEKGASHLNALRASGRVALVQNSSLVYVCPQIEWDKSASDYWRKQVVSCLRSTTQKPGQGAVKSHAVHE